MPSRTQLRFGFPTASRVTFTILGVDPNIGDGKEGVVQDHEPRCSPRDPIEMVAGDRPEERRREKLLVMRRDVDEDVERPSKEPQWDRLSNAPDEEEHRCADDHTMGEMIAAENVIWDGMELRLTEPEVAVE